MPISSIDKTSANTKSPWRFEFLNVLLVGGVVFSMAILGILTRPTGLLAAFWPANAVLLGMLVRFPCCARPSGWLAAFFAYISADLISGSTLISTTILTIGNLSGVVVGYILFKLFSSKIQGLSQSLSIIYLTCIVIVASAIVGLVGMIANPVLFNGGALEGLSYWFATELVNYLTVLPVLLTFPKFKIRNLIPRKATLTRVTNIQNLAPVVSLLLSMLLAAKIGGSVALTFLMPSLLWCALSYEIFITAVLTLLCSMWVLLAAATGVLNIGINNYDHNLLETLRFGVTLISLAPLTIATVIASRNLLIEKLNYASTHDVLTGVLNRRGFMDSAVKLFSQLSSNKKSLAVMMLDIDRFKNLNDTHGHKVGDTVLSEFARLTLNCIRETDVFGRTGGEEFSILIADCTSDDASLIAQRICERFAKNAIPISTGTDVKMTVSIGLAFLKKVNITAEVALDIADKELYKAKTAGRNRVSSVCI